MATTTWTGGSADWATAADWSAGVPNSTTIVANLAGTASYTVTIANGESFAVGTLNLTDANAGLSINSGGVLTVTTALNLNAGTLTLAGKISGGKLVEAGGAIAFANGSLSGVKFQGVMDLSANSAQVNIYSGTVLTGASGTGNGTVNLTGYYSTLAMQGTQTLDKATINFGVNSGTDYLSATDNGGAATLTLGAGLQIVSAGLSANLTGSGDATIVNLGKITDATSGDALTINPGSFANAGTISVANGGIVYVNAANGFSNTGSIAVTNGGILHLQSSLTTGGLGTITTASAGTVVLDGALDNTGGTFKVGTGSALGKVTLTGSIAGGAITDAGSGFTFSNSTLDGVKYEGTMDLSANSATVNVYDGITLTGAAGSGNGTVNDTGYYSYMVFYGTQTLDKATIKIGANSGTSYLQVDDTAPGATLSLGAGLIVTSAGINAELTSNTALGKIVNAGKIIAGTASGSFTINPGIFVNTGTITVSNGESLYLRAGTGFSNKGTITVTTGGVLHLQDSLATGSLGTIKVTAPGVVALDGTLNNTSAVFKTGTGSLLGKVTLDGTIRAGVITDAGSGFTFSSGVLDGVKYEGTMDLSANSATVNIYDGITLTGTGGTGNGTINDTGYYSDLYFHGSQTVDKATIKLGTNSGTSTLYLYDLAAAATLTLGANLTITSAGTSAAIGGASDASIVNKGVINAGTASGAFTINPGAFTNAGTMNISNTEICTINVADGFSNTGTIKLTAGGVLHLQNQLITGSLGTITVSASTVFLDGLLDNAAATLTVGTGSGLGKVTLDGTIQNGIIADKGSGFTFAAGNLDAVTYEGALNLTTNSASVNIYDGITLTGTAGTGTGTLNDTGYYSSVNFRGTQTIDKATINIGSSTGTDYLEIYNIGPAATLTFGTGLKLVSAGPSVQLGGNGSIVNKGSITAGTASGTFGISTYKFTNSGTLLVKSGATLNLQPSYKFTNLSGTTLSGGSYEVDAGSLLQLSNNLSIVTDNATIILSGSSSVIQSYSSFVGSQVSLDATLTHIAAAGTLELLANRSFSTAAAFVNAGKLDLAGGTFTAASLTASATALLSGYGKEVGAFTNSGTVTASGGTLDLKGAVTGTAGTLSIGSGATTVLELGSSIANGESITFTATSGTLEIDNAAGFAAKGVTGFVAGDKIDLANVAFGAHTTLAYGGTTSQGTLTVSDGTHTAKITLFGQYIAAGFGKATDGAAGTLITYNSGGALSPQVQLAAAH